MPLPLMFDSANCWFCVTGTSGFVLTEYIAFWLVLEFLYDWFNRYLSL
jgi:hypothetical protein